MELKRSLSEGLRGKGREKALPGSVESLKLDAAGYE
jgi:hypothetical protein